MIDLLLWPYPSTKRERLLWIALRVGSVLSFVLLMVRILQEWIGLRHEISMVNPTLQIAFWVFIYPSLAVARAKRIARSAGKPSRTP